MLIWLGKTYLGQKDQPDTNLSQHTNIVVDAALLSNLQQSYQSLSRHPPHQSSFPP